jgi:hypothetical protein
MRSASPSGRGPLTASQTYRNPETRVQHLVRDHGPAIRVTEALSRVASIDRLMSLGLFPIGSAVAGPAAAVFGVRVPLVAAAVWILGSTAIVLAVPSVRQVRLIQTTALN